MKVFHDEADALLPQGEEGEANGEVDSLGEAFVGQEVLVGAGGEEGLLVAEFGLQNPSSDIFTELLILRLVIDIARGEVGLVLVDLLHILMCHAAKRGTNEIRGWLEIERKEDLVQLRVLREVVLEPARDLRLLRLGEGLKAIVDRNDKDLASLREVEVGAPVEPGRLHLGARLAVHIRNELRFNIDDDVDLTVPLIVVRPRRVVHELFILLHQEGLECGQLDQPILVGLDYLPACHVLNLVSGEEHRQPARIEEVIIVEPHRLPHIFEQDFIQVPHPVQVRLVVLSIEVVVELMGLLVLLRNRLLSFSLCNLVKLLKESFPVGRGPRDVLGKPLPLRLLLSLFLLSLPPHRLELLSPCILSRHLRLRRLRHLL